MAEFDRNTPTLRIRRACLELAQSLKDLKARDARLMLHLIGNLRDIADRYEA